MKLTKMAGAFALTAAMAMAAVPAFAAPGATNEDQFYPTGDFNDNQASQTTEVYAELINKYLDATIPTKVAIVIPGQGGAITAPSSTAYKIHNNTTTNAIKLVKLNSKAAAGGVFKLAVPGTSSTPTDAHVFALTLNTGSQTFNLDGTPQTTTAVPEIASNSDLPLQLAGNYYPKHIGSSPDVLTAANLTSAVMEIEYTIGIGKTNGATS